MICHNSWLLSFDSVEFGDLEKATARLRNISLSFWMKLARIFKTKGHAVHAYPCFKRRCKVAGGGGQPRLFSWTSPQSLQHSSNMVGSEEGAISMWSKRSSDHQRSHSFWRDKIPTWLDQRPSESSRMATASFYSLRSPTHSLVCSCSPKVINFYFCFLEECLRNAVCCSVDPIFYQREVKL